VKPEELEEGMFILLGKKIPEDIIKKTYEAYAKED